MPSVLRMIGSTLSNYLAVASGERRAGFKGL